MKLFNKNWRVNFSKNKLSEIVGKNRGGGGRVVGAAVSGTLSWRGGEGGGKPVRFVLYKEHQWFKGLKFPIFSVWKLLFLVSHITMIKVTKHLLYAMQCL